jgi:hypothetical protein
MQEKTSSCREGGVMGMLISIEEAKTRDCRYQAEGVRVYEVKVSELFKRGGTDNGGHKACVRVT